MNSKQMTLKQKLLKAVYPVFLWLSKKSSKENEVIVNKTAIPAISFYSLTDTLITGMPFSFEQLKGKMVMLVNTASDCGYTQQYDDLQKLQQQYQNTLLIIGFPSNDFQQQEKGDDKSIATFCKLNYGITFPLMKKSIVIKTPAQNKTYQWLTDKQQNGWNEKGPSWNFCKYLVDENGKLTHFFSAAIEPLGIEVQDALSLTAEAQRRRNH